MSHQDGSVYKMIAARPLACLHAKLDLIWHLFPNINILFWCENWLPRGLPVFGEWCLRWRRTCLFLADYLHAGLIEMGLPLLTSSFEVILHCKPAFHGPGLSGHSPVGLKQLCTLCAMYYILSMQWIPIQISASHHSACLFTYFYKGCYFGSAFLSVSGLLFSCSFHSLPNFLCIQFCSAELDGVCTSECGIVFFKKLESSFAVACHSFCVQAR